MNRLFTLFLIFIFSLLCSHSLLASDPDGGMYPISMLDKVPLKNAGLRISESDIYNPNGKGLLQAVVQLGGCTGSFISNKGLIITNHHCAFGSLEPYSTPQNNLMQDGYLAENMARELPMKGMTCKILEKHRDISAEALRGTENLTEAVAKRKLIDANLANLRQAEQLKNPDYLVEVSEMLPGKNYLLFYYKMLKDIRIVYIPPRNVGEFGGETDNWEWPRHNGDFSLVRAYVGKDGKPAAFDSANVPYSPQEYLNINANGLTEGDFVFILGFPGRTFRHQPSDFVSFHQNVQLPYIAGLYKWQIETIHELGKQNAEWMLRQEPRVKQLANVQKNYEGKIKTIAAIDLVEQKKHEEKQISDQLASKPGLQKEFKSILSRFDSLYARVKETGLKNMWYNQITNESPTLRMVWALDQFITKYPSLRDKPDELKKAKESLISQYRSNYKNIYLPYDREYLNKMLSDAYTFQATNRINAVENLDSYGVVPSSLHGKRTNSLVSFWLDMYYAKSKLFDTTYTFSLVREKPQKLLKMKEPLVRFTHDLYADAVKVDSVQTNLRTQIDNLLPRYVDIKMEAMDQLFIPDANRTLRLTYGYIKSYSPSDGITMLPMTTVDGMLEKEGLSPDYMVNDNLKIVYKRHLPSPYETKDKKSVPIGILYNTDTTGGNSGSPVLNKFGQLVGLNFDRTFEATVNDYAWNDNYSRSIGLDIRFVLWMLTDVAHANHLVSELFIDNSKE